MAGKERDSTRPAIHSLPFTERLAGKKGKSPYEHINDRPLSKHANGVHWWESPQLRSVFGIAGGAWSV